MRVGGGGLTPIISQTLISRLLGRDRRRGLNKGTLGDYLDYGLGEGKNFLPSTAGSGTNSWVPFSPKKNSEGRG